MKNIHILPTDKPSRLYKSKITQDVFISDNRSQHGDATYNVNIYITSDEEIKEGDWFMIFTNKKPVAPTKAGLFDSDCKKIILTTDQDLINDGVQKIANDFLEWFVKNPSCEEVEIGYGWIRLTETDNEGYWVSIPNKQFEMQQEEPTQETLEELAKEFYSDENQLMERIAFKRGYTECEERMYSEEEVLDFGKFCISKIADFLDGKGDQTDGQEYSMKELLEQFKKK